MTILTNKDFTNKVLDSDKITFVEFFATWCPHCQAFMPKYKEIASELGNQADFYQVEIDDSPDLANEYGIAEIPTIIVFNDGQEITSFVGAQPESTFQNVINDLNN